MESGKTDTFTERMLRRASTKTLLRRQKILQALDNNNYEIQPIIVNHVDRNALVSSLSTAINHLQQQINDLDMKKIPEETSEEDSDGQINIYPTLSAVRETKNINSETRTIEDECVPIGETPKPRRRGYKPNMESTRASLMTSNPDPMTSTETKSSMQPESSISTIPVIGESRDDRIPYEVERFLEDALGDELNNTTVTYGEQSDGRDRTNSYFNASELISEDRSPFYKRISKFWNHERRDFSYTEEGFSKGVRDSSTLDKSMKIYKSLSQRIKKKIRAALNKNHPQSPPPTVSAAPLQPLSFDKDRMDQLENILKHMKIQQCIIHQASKALNVCHTSKEFLGSSEQIESERLLLLAEIRKNLLHEQLKRLSNTSEDVEIQLEESSEITECAEVTIENVNLALRECLRREPLPGEPIDWFIIVVIEGTNVWGSSPTPRPIDSMILDISDFICTIDNLKPNFKIIIQVYSLKLKSGVFLNHEDKYHINNSRMNETFICPSPSKFLKRIEKGSPRMQVRQGIFSSSFVKSGEMELGLHDLGLSSPWALNGVPHGSFLLGTIDVNLSCKLHLSICHQGFLNYGEDAGGFVTWNRRWCVLKGNMLMFWNYPREQEVKEPLRKIDLIHCTDERIEQVSRELCAKPRTIVVETVRIREIGDMDSILMNCRQSYTVQRHLLSYDSRKDVNDWKMKLNHVISALREWNVTFMRDPPKSPMVSEL